MFSQNYSIKWGTNCAVRGGRKGRKKQIPQSSTTLTEDSKNSKHKENCFHTENRYPHLAVAEKKLKKWFEGKQREARTEKVELFPDNFRGGNFLSYNL